MLDVERFTLDVFYARSCKRIRPSVKPSRRLNRASQRVPCVLLPACQSQTCPNSPRDPVETGKETLRRRKTYNVQRKIFAPDFFAKFAIQVYFEFYERGKIVKLFRRDC